MSIYNILIRNAQLLSAPGKKKSIAVAARRDQTVTRAFTLKEIIAEPLPNVSDYPCYS
ncbi:MAG: hypothetical protein ABIL11_17455 [Chloroflexota bacterium]